MKKHIDFALHNFCASGQGDSGKKRNNNADDNDNDDSYNSLDSVEVVWNDNKKGISKEYSLKVYSSNFFSFVKHNPVLFYFYTAMIIYNLLESCSSDMDDKYAENSWLWPNSDTPINCDTDFCGKYLLEILSR